MADQTRLPATPFAGSPADDWRCAWAEHQRWLRTVLFARLRDHDVVDEALQQVALAASKGAANLRDPSKLVPWLYRLAVTAVLQYRRQAGRHRKLHYTYSEQSIPVEDCHEPDPLNWLIAEEQREIVRHALAELADRDAEILLLKYTENWSYRELADHLGLTTSAVEARLHRARHRMRQALAKLEVATV